MNVLFSPEGFEDYRYWQTQDHKTLKKINALILAICRGNDDKTGKAEILKGELSGFLSRRINLKHRLVYRIEGDVVLITHCRYHYGDK